MTDGLQPGFMPPVVDDETWGRLQSVIPAARQGGRPRTTDPRVIVEAILFMIATGATLRQLPALFPPWGTVNYYYRTWRMNGVWDQIEAIMAQPSPSSPATPESD